METTIHRLIEKHLYVTDKQAQMEIAAVALGYLLRATKAKDLNEVVAEYSDINPLALRDALKKRYVLKNLKLWLWWCIQRDLSYSNAVEAMDEFEIRPRDLELLALIQASEYMDELKQLATEYRSVSLKSFEANVTKVALEQEVYVKKFVYTKLKFLQYSGYSDMTDTFYELQYEGLKGMLVAYPKVKSKLHLTNVYKATVQNSGQNMIKHHTTKSRGVLRREADGTFTSIKVSMDASENVNWNTSLATTESLDGSERETTTTTVDVNRLLDKTEGVNRRFLILLKGDYCIHFSKFLHSKGINKDNDDLYEHLYRRDIRDYINLAAEYLCINPYNAHLFLNELRREMRT